jgi:glutathione S-transferase
VFSGRLGQAKCGIVGSILLVILRETRIAFILESTVTERSLKMKIHFSAASPYVRKCMVVAHELGLADRIEKLPSAAHPVNRDKIIVANNPLGKVPTFFADDGMVLYDSRVICEYLNDVGNGKLLPPSGREHWQVLTQQSLGDGILDAALLMRYEAAMRPESSRWLDWTNGQMEKVQSGLAQIDLDASAWGDRVDIGKITLGCALGYLDFRFAHVDWRVAYPNAAAWFDKFNTRASMQATLPKA